jgi:predicted RNA-binding Zn ribbon-like protein
MNVKKMEMGCEGKPAPVPLLAVQAFANTLDVEDDVDHLASTESFAAWLRDVELAGRNLEVREGDLTGALRLRDAVRGLLSANTTGERDPDAAALLARLASRHHVAIAADRDGNLTPDLEPVRRAEQFVPQLLAVIFQAQATGTWPRLKLCQNPECLWAFYDSSKNRSGTWCRMGLCGNRLKNRAYRERQRSE